MSDFLIWLTNNPTASMTIITGITILLVAITLIYLVAFFQGREISFWPPKIGPQSASTKSIQEKSGSSENIGNQKELIFLKGRADLQPLEEQIKNASEIVIVAISANSLIGAHYALLENKLKDGCKLRVALLDPKSPAVNIWNTLAKETTIGKDMPTQPEIESTLNYLNALRNSERVKGQCEIRLTHVFPPFSMVIIDPHNKSTCSMIVEFYAFKTPPSNRPHIRLHTLSEKLWFDFYMQQFEKIWNDSKEWKSLSKDIV